MKRRDLLVILFCGGLWGLSEALLGGWMFSAKLNLAAPVVLAVIAFAILTVARIHVPLSGSSTAIATLAMLFKFLNSPFFACHLLAIFLLGAAFDLVFSLVRGRARPLAAAAATYLGFALFALTITYVFQYRYWSGARVLLYIGRLGSIAAACNVAMVPLSYWLGHELSNRALAKSALRRWALPVMSVATTAVLALAVIRGIQAAAG